MDEQDPALKPDPSVPNQDQLSDREPSQDYLDPEATEEDLGGGASLLADLDRITQELSGATEETEEDDPAIEPLAFAAPDTIPAEAEIPEIELADFADIPRALTDEIRDLPLDLTSEPGEADGGLLDLDHLDEAAAALEAKGRDIEAFHGGRLGGEIPQINEESNSSAGGMDDDQLRDALESDYRNRKTSADFIVDHARRIDDLTLAIERSRI